MDGPCRVILSSEMISEARALGNETYKLFQHNYGYYTNTPDPHIRGKLGEIAVAWHLVSTGFEIQKHYQSIDSLSLCDIELISDIKYPIIEVKTWNERYWDELGRCVAVGQYSSICQKPDVIIWCVCPEELNNVRYIDICG